MKDFDNRYMAEVLAIHDKMGLEADNGVETRLWHMLRSLVEFCDEQGIDLDALLQDVREDARAA